jgi:hypothetical protein
MVRLSQTQGGTGVTREEPFDEGFPDAAFEDTEAARRWAKQSSR